MGAPTFVNGGSNTGVFNNAGGGTNTCLIPWAQTANDTLVIVIAYHGVGSQPTVGVTDTAGNGYTVTAPAGSVDLGFGNGLCVATATGIHAAGANTNTVSITFTGATPSDDIAIITEYSASAGLDSTSPTATVIAGTTPSTSYTTGFGGVLALQMAYDSSSYTAATGAWTDRSGSTALSNGLNYADQAVVTAGTVVNTSINGASSDNCILMIGLQGTGAITGESDVVFSASAPGTGSGALSGTSAVTANASVYLPQFAKLGDFDAAAFALTWFDGTEDVGGWWDRVDIPSGPPGAILGSSGVVFTASGTLAGAGALLGASGVIFTAAGTLQGAGALVGSAVVVSTASATLSGSGALVGASNVVFAAQATPSLSGTSTVIFSASATPSIIGSAAVVFAASGTLTGSGALSGTSAAIFNVSASPTQPGIVGESDAVFAASGTLLGAGVLAGESDVVFATSGTLRGAGAIAGSSVAVFSSSATIVGAGAMLGESDAIFQTAGTLTLWGTSQVVFATSGTAAAAAQGATSNIVFDTSGTISGGAPPVTAAGGWAWGGRGTTAPSRKRFRTAADAARDADEAEELEAAAEAPTVREDEGLPTYIGPLVFKGEGRTQLAGYDLTQSATGNARHDGAASHGFPLCVGQQASGTALHHGIASQAFDSALVETRSRAERDRARRQDVADEVLRLALEETEGRFAAERQATAARAASDREQEIARAARERQDADVLAAREREDLAVRADSERQAGAAREAALQAQIDAQSADHARQDAEYRSAIDAAQAGWALALDTAEKGAQDAAALRQELAEVTDRGDTYRRETEARQQALSAELTALAEARAKSEADYREALERALAEKSSVLARLEEARRDAVELQDRVVAGIVRADAAAGEAEASDRRIMAMVDALTRAGTAKDSRIASLEAELAAERGKPPAPPVVREVEVVRRVEVESPAQAAKISELTQRLIAVHGELARAHETIEAMRGRATTDASVLNQALAQARVYALEQTDRADVAEARAHDLTGRLAASESRPPEVRIVADKGLKVENDRLTRRIVALMNVPRPDPEVRTVDRIVRVAVEDSTRVERLQAELAKKTAEAKAARKLAARMYIAHLHAAAMKPPEPPITPIVITARKAR